MAYNHNRQNQGYGGYVYQGQHQQGQSQPQYPPAQCQPGQSQYAQANQPNVSARLDPQQYSQHGYGNQNPVPQQYQPAQSQAYRSPPPRPPYPTSDYASSAGSSPQPLYNPSPSSPGPASYSSYNPSNYGYISPPNSPPIRQGFAPPPGREPQPYNPALYSSSSIANVADEMFGPIYSAPSNVSPTAYQQHYSTYASSPPQHPQPLQPTSMAGHGPRMMPQSSIRHPAIQPPTAPLPQRTFSGYEQQPYPPPLAPSLPLPPPRETPSNAHASANAHRANEPMQPSIHQPSTSQRTQAPSEQQSQVSRPYSFQLTGDPLGFSLPPIQDHSDDEPNWGLGGSSRVSPRSRKNSDEIYHSIGSSSPTKSASRPLPGIPIELEPDDGPTHRSTQHPAMLHQYSGDANQQDLYGALGQSLGRRLSASTSSGVERQDSYRSKPSLSPSTSHSRAPSNRSNNSTGGRSDRRYRLSGSSSPLKHYGAGYESDDSDAEAEAGLKAMRDAAEEERATELRRQSSEEPSSLEDGSYTAQIQRAPTDKSTLSDDGPTMEEMAGAYLGPEIAMTHFDDPLLLARPRNDPSGVQGQHPSNSSTKSGPAWSNDGFPHRGSSQTSTTSMGIHEEVPRVDQAGTGGNMAPALSERRLSFDEGPDDQFMAEGLGQPPLAIPYAGGAVSLIDRPLPAVPQENRTSPNPGYHQSWQQPQPPNGPISYPSPYTYNLQGQSSYPYDHIVRTTSDRAYTGTPRPNEPARSATEGRPAKRQPPRITTTAVSSLGETELQTPAALDLPVLPRDGFQPSRLSYKDFDRCTAPWALSSISHWLRVLASRENELREHTVYEALTALISHKNANLNITLAESLATTVLHDLYASRVLIKDEEWLRFGGGTATGVLFQLTGKGCYSVAVHEYDFKGRCYSSHCQRTVRKLDLQREITRTGSDWASYHNLTTADVEGATQKDRELQNNLHEVVTSEDNYMDSLNVLSSLYRDALATANPPIINPRRLPDFVKGVFGKLDGVKKCNEEHLLPQLKYRQQEQGPWIKSFSDIFRNWIRKARTPYIEYAANFPHANWLMKQEETKNSMFVSFVEKARTSEASKRLDWASHLRAPITRLQRYSLLLATVQKNTPATATDELTNLAKALEEIRSVTMECDTRVAEMSKKVDMFNLQAQLELRPEMKHVELNLTHLGRELLHRGDLQRPGQKSLSMVQTHAILLDNYLVLAKQKKDANSATKYDVSKMPIPMDLLTIESREDPPVEPSKFGKAMVAASRPGASTAPGARENRGRNGSNVTGTAVTGALTQVATNDSTSGRIGPAVNLDDNSDGRILYPFRIKHLGRETYMLCASTSRDRDTWVEKILEAKTKHAHGLFSQNAEPFKLNVLADSAFAYDSAIMGKPEVIRGTPLQRAVAEVDRLYGQTGRPSPVCRARVNCATSFRPPSGRQMLAVGTDYGVYIAEAGDIRGWSKAIAGPRITQIAVLEDFNLLILISDKALIAYHLDTVVSTTSGNPDGATSGPSLTSSFPQTTLPQSSSSHRRAPQKLSGAASVSFFAMGRLKDRHLIIYKKGSGMSSSSTSTFKIIEPVLHRVAEKSRSRAFLSKSTGLGHLESFRDYDDFYIPAESSGLEIFNNTLAVATSKGFEVLNLDKKTPFSVPALQSRDVASIARRLEAAGAPRAMFRLSSSSTTSAESEFLCVYEECAVYINKYADVNRSVVMEFVGRAKAASLVHGVGKELFLVLFDEEFVEVRDALGGRLKQIIPGRDVRCLDDGRSGGGQQTTGGASLAYGAGGFGGLAAGLGGLGVDGGFGAVRGAKRSVKFALQHPEYERNQIIVELVSDEGRLG